MRKVLALLVLLWPVAAQAGEAEWSAPHAPYKVAGNVYAVGTEGIGVYLITTPQGHILIDGATEKGAAVVEANIAALGFKLHDIKYMVETHAHWDHVGGVARLKRDTGAVFVASEGDRYGLEHGVHVGDNVYGGGAFAPVHVDRTIGEGGTLTLGGITLTAHMTPGHTRGDTTWTTDVNDKGVVRRIIFYGSTTTAGNVLVNNHAYPDIVADYRLSFKRLKALKADILLTNHPELADIETRYQAQLHGQAEAFVDQQALPKLVAKSEADFEAELKHQQDAHKGKHP